MFENKNVFITGASGDIGFAVAKAFICDSANVVLHYNSNSEKFNILDELALKYKVFVKKISIDFSSADTIKEAMKNDVFNNIDIVVHAAGIISDASAFLMNDEAWQQVMDINLSAPFYITRSLLRIISKRKGNIIFVSSVSGLAGNAGQVNYSASKAGIIGMTKTLAKELSRYGVRVNCVLPGYIKSKMTASLKKDKIADIEKNIPMSRMGKPEEVADAVLFLASEKAAYITGEVLNVSGGFYI